VPPGPNVEPPLAIQQVSKFLRTRTIWWGFAGASDRQPLAAFIRRSDRNRFVPANLPMFADLCRDADETMFAAITSDHNPLVHKTTTCGSVHITLLSLLELVISLTITLSNACSISTYTSIFILYFNSLT